MNTRPNILVLCIDQWQARMRVPPEARLPALRRLEAQGVTFDRYYCTTPICTPSRATMWTGLHGKKTGLWDNTNFAWIEGLSTDIRTVGHMLRELGYYTAFQGKWHLTDVPRGLDALEPFGFADFQSWGDVFGTPLQGETIDAAIAFGTVDWLEHRAPRIREPWMLVSSIVSPHDIMYLQTDPIETPQPGGLMSGLQTRVQRLGWFQERWDVGLPDNFADDYRLQAPAVAHYKAFIDANYGGLPDDRADLWIERRNYLLNCMRLADAHLLRVLDALDRTGRWDDTVVILTGDHGEMNGAHRMTQKGGIHFDEAAIVNLTVCAPGGPRGRRTAAIGTHLDLVPTLLAIAGLDEGEIRRRHPHLAGHSLLGPVRDPGRAGPRGSADAPGKGGLYCWDGLHQLDVDWSITGALRELMDLPAGVDRAAAMRAVGRKYGAPDFGRRTFFRAVVDGRYKLVRWFSPLEHDHPPTLARLHATGDVTLHDLVNDPGEMENLGHPNHPRYDPALVEHMLHKLGALVREELGDDRAPFDLDLFGTREVKYRRGDRERAARGNVPKPPERRAP